MGVAVIANKSCSVYFTPEEAQREKRGVAIDW